MTPADVIDVLNDALMTSLLVSAPMLAACFAVGVAVSLLQALTQIQESVLTFVPKLLAAGAALLLGATFIGHTLSSFMGQIATRIVGG